MTEHDVESGSETDTDAKHAMRHAIVSAALDAERSIGQKEETEQEARRGVFVRVARLVLGWILVLLGLAAIPLPGPGWVMVLIGLSLLPYVWAERTIVEIRKRVPGIPEDGRIPTVTWVVMGVLIAAASFTTYFYGDVIVGWIT
jgi:hypothetical protein